MSGFHEILFPLAIGLEATGGPRWRTEIVALASGYETRNARWSSSRRHYNAGTGVRSLDDLSFLTAFFEERGGRRFGFRFLDPADSSSGLPGDEHGPTDQAIGTGDGSTDTFQLIKTYGAGHAPVDRVIAKPVAGTVRIAVDGLQADLDTEFSVDETSGLVSFLPPAVPAEGATITAGYRFHVPVRFDTDDLKIDHFAFAAGAVPAIPLVEIRS